ncbi:MAG TPA: leucine-rich repeat protein [Clostridiales bacterium]|nr:leucine-rich repeat protein [Clostridiales bacterium]
MKKSLGLLLATALFLLLFTAPVSAGTTGDGFVYDGSDGMLWITDYVGSGGEVTVPSAIDGVHVSGIGDYAFAGCSQITAMTIPDSTLFIGNYAFSNCTAMTSLTIGENVDYIGENAFENCIHLSTILWNVRNCGVPRNCGPFSNAGTAGAGISITFGDRAEVVPEMLFVPENDSRSPHIVSVTLGKKVRSIGHLAFKNCEITSIIIPDSVTRIGSSAFYGCDLASVHLGTGIEFIYYNTFAHCPLTSVTIPDNVDWIDSYAFNGCSQLASVTFGSGLSAVTSYAFLNCPKLKEVFIPKNVLYLNPYAFGYYYDDADLYKGELIVTGYTYSAAEQYAKDNGFAFVSLGGAFADVAAGKWYEPYIDDLVVQGIFSGYANVDGTHSFRPDKKITRAEFAVILARAAKADLTAYANKSSFSDVSASGWAGPAIEWAYQSGVVSGIGSGKYAPNANITRQDMAVMICRFAEAQSLTLPAAGDASVFADVGDISSYALDAVNSLHQAGIISGSTSGGKLIFQPKKGASRGEAAKMISVLLDS